MLENLDDTDGRKQLQERYNHYEKESKRGIEGYNNPYDFAVEMEDLIRLSCIEYKSEEYLGWERKIAAIEKIFWEM